jgi:hypothetical protein
MGTWPNLEEFDLVIIAQNTLTQEMFDQIADKPDKIFVQIWTLYETGRSIWCIVDKKLVASQPKTGPKASLTCPRTSYDWLFVYPSIREIEGSSIQIVDEKFTPYLQKVRRWGQEIDGLCELGPDGVIKQSVNYFLTPIAKNKSGKMLGGRVFRPEQEPFQDSDSIHLLPETKFGSICFLPRPSECDTHEAIEILIDIASGEERVEPEWRSKVQVPGIGALEKQINERRLDFKKQMDDLESKWQALDKYRDLFSVHEAPQIDAIITVLSDIGFETQKTKPGFPVDLLGDDLAVEVTSISGNVNSGSPKMFQLMQFFENHRKSEKVVLIANTFKREFPSNRSGKKDFTPQVIAYMQSKNICAMTCVTLFELWRLTKKNPIQVKKQILQTNGELRL